MFWSWWKIGLEEALHSQNQVILEIPLTVENDKKMIVPSDFVRKCTEKDNEIKFVVLTHKYNMYS